VPGHASRSIDPGLAFSSINIDTMVTTISFRFDYTGTRPQKRKGITMRRSHIVVQIMALFTWN
jgi:hypothetical protein